MTYYMFNEPALNGFSPLLKEKFTNHGVYKLINEIKVPIKTLSSLLDDNLPTNTEIDFLSIDVEGLDFDVLKSNDWCKYKPNIILIESWNNDIESLFGGDIYINFYQIKTMFCMEKL